MRNMHDLAVLAAGRHERTVSLSFSISISHRCPLFRKDQGDRFRANELRERDLIV